MDNLEKANNLIERCRDRGIASRECADILVALAQKHGDPELACDAARYVLKLFEDATDSTKKVGAPARPPLSENQLKELMRDPRYWRDRDPEIIEKVRQGFRRLFPQPEARADD